MTETGLLTSRLGSSGKPTSISSGIGKYFSMCDEPLDAGVDHSWISHGRPDPWGQR